MTNDAGRDDGADEETLTLSLVRGDALYRAQRAVGLIPAGSLGLGRRAVLLALITWAPTALWAVYAHRALPGVPGEPLLQHFGIHVRCLVAIPLLVIAEGMAHAVSTRIVPYFVASGLVRERDVPAFREVVRGVTALRDSTRPWVVLLAILAAWTFLAPLAADVHEIVWASESGEATARAGFGAFWFLYVTRPIYFALLLGWVWRVVLLFVLLARIARVDLSLVPSHPDGASGLAFLEGLPSAFSLVAFASSTVVASRWAHDVVYHGVHVDSLRVPALALLVVNVLLFTGPLLAFVPKLAPLKRAALLQYGALVGEQGRLVHRRWIDGDDTVGSEAVLSAPEIGPVADANALYEAVSRSRTMLVGKRALLAVAVPTALPLLAMFAIEVPVKDLLLKLVSTLA